MNSVYFSFNVDARENVGKKFNANLKAAGRVPGIIYGNRFLKPISIDANELNLLVNSIYKGVNVFECNFNNDKFLVVVKEVQDHPYKREYMHIDFQRVDVNSIVSINVFFRFLGFDVSPGLKNGGVLIKHMSSILVKCKVSDIPSDVIVDLSNLGLNQSIYLSDLKFVDTVSIPSFYSKSKFLVSSIVGARVFDDSKSKDNEKDKDKDKEKDKDKSKNKEKDKALAKK
ncbi:MAG TPA: 50S ribosomal protein L25 [Candidatus Azoamicus sp.]